MVCPTVRLTHTETGIAQTSTTSGPRESPCYHSLKPLNIYKVVVDASFTTFRSLVRVAVDDIISPLCCIVLKRESEEENKKGREGHRSKSLGPLARGRKTTWEGRGALGRFSAEVDDETRTSGAFLARLNCSMLSPGLIRVKLLWVKWR